MSIPQIPVRQAAAQIDDWTALDVREPHEYDGPLGHIAGAQLHPLGRLPASLRETAKDARLLLVCRSGKRSQRACEMLQALGFEQVANLEGGMIAWNEARLPLRRSAFGSIDSLVDNLVAYLAQVTPAGAETVRRSLDELLEQAGSSADAPSAAALEWALHELADSARHPSPPADLELALAAYRSDLALL